MKFFWLVVGMLSLAACGGGSNGSIGVTSVQTSVSYTTPATVSASVTTAKGTPVGLDVEFTTNRPDLVSVRNVTPVNNAGVATAQIVALRTSPTAVNITVFATAGDLRSSMILPLKPYSLNVTVPADQTYSVDAASAGGVVSFIPVGSFAQFVDPSNIGVQGSTVTVEFITVMGTVAATPVEIWANNDSDPVLPVTRNTFVTDADGKIPIQYTFSTVAAAPGAQSVTTYIWRFTVTDPGGSAIFKYGTNQVTVTTDAA